MTAKGTAIATNREAFVRTPYSSPGDGLILLRITAP
jgi:hypothetical protein